MIMPTEALSFFSEAQEQSNNLLVDSTAFLGGGLRFLRLYEACLECGVQKN